MKFFKEWRFDYSAEELEFRIIEKLKENGYFVVAEIDVQNIIRKNFNKDVGFFRILEICKPLAALELIETDKLSGLFVPCKVNIIGGERSSILRIILLDEVSVNFIPNQYGIFNKFQEELIKAIENFHKDSESEVG